MSSWVCSTRNKFKTPFWPLSPKLLDSKNGGVSSPSWKVGVINDRSNRIKVILFKNSISTRSFVHELASMKNGNSFCNWCINAIVLGWVSKQDWAIMISNNATGEGDAIQKRSVRIDLKAAIRWRAPKLTICSSRLESWALLAFPMKFSTLVNFLEDIMDGVLHIEG